MYPSSEPNKAQNTSRSLSKYVFKHSLSQNANDKYDTELSQVQACSGIASQMSNSSSKDVFRRIAEIAKRHDTPDFQLPNRKLYNSAVKRNNRKDNFISFSQLQKQNKIENDEHLFNNSFEFDETVVNDYKMDSQWNCDTQLATLVDNADALMNIASSKEMTQFWPNKIDRCPTELLLVDNTSLNNNKNDYLDTLSVCSTANSLPNSRGISITQPTYLDADNATFKVPPLKNSILNVPSQTISKSQPIESTSSSMEPLLYSQDCGLKNVGVISVKSHSKYLNENYLVEEYAQLNENKLSDVVGNRLLVDCCRDVNGSLVSCNSKLVDAMKHNATVKDLEEDSHKLAKSNDASHNVLLNKTYNVSKEPHGVLTTKVVNAEDWEQFFNSTMNSSYPSNASKDESHNSDEDIPSSPILVSQKTIEKKSRGKFPSTKNLTVNCLKVSKIQSDFTTNLMESEKETLNDVHKIVERRVLREKNIHSSELDNQKTKLISDQNKYQIEKDSAFLDDNFDDGNIIFEVPTESGFMTANSKPITISQELIEKAKSLFDDIELESEMGKIDFDMYEEKIHNGNINNVSVCNKYDDQKIIKNDINLATNLKNFVQDPMLEIVHENNNEDILKVEYNLMENGIVKNNEEEQMNISERIKEKPNKFCGFTTASNKKIGISEVALKKAQAVINKIEEATDEGTESKPNKFCGFTTASNKQISISEVALKKAQAVINKIEEATDEGTESKPNKFCGFTTASNKQISISEVALKKAQAVINKIEEATDEVNDSIPNKFCGFTTASNKQISVSEVALKKAQAVINNIEEATDEVNDSIPNKVCGFTTASNKQISVSEVALKKAQAVINNIEEATDEVNDSIPNKVCGFTTASNKQIGISEVAPKKAHAVINKIEEATDEGTESKPNKFGGFTTASNKQISISEVALKKAQAVINKIEEATDEVNDSIPNKFCGFTTGSNKQISISEVALKKAQAVINKIEEATDEVNDSIPNKFCGFTTASNKQISISEVALKKAEAVINNIEEATDEVNDSIPNKFCGFTTASNKQISISEVALKKAQAVINKIEEASDEVNDSIPNKFCGFTTASNKQIIVSEVALKKAQAVINNIEEATDEVNYSIPNKFCGFTTASNKQISISEVALKKAQAVINKIEEAKDEVNDSIPNKFCGFTTASNKQISVSEVALKKAQAVINNIEEATDEVNDSIPNKFCGFTTASNKQISISEVALKKAQAVIDAIDVEKDLGTVPDPIRDSIAFNERICVSGGAAINSQGIYDEKVIKDKLKQFGENTNDNLLLISTKSHMHNSTFLNGNTSIGLTQEIEDSTKAFLNDEDKYSLNEGLNMAAEAIEYPPSPILPSRSKKAKRVFQAPYKDDSIQNAEQAESFLKKRKVENPVVTLNNTVYFHETDCLGNLLDVKLHSSNRNTLKNFKPNCQGFTGEEIDVVTPENVEQFIFKNDRIDIPLKNITSDVTVHNIAEIFSSNSSVNQKLIPDKWILNHLKWIIWKLASYERFFKEQFSGILTVGNVLKQLKYRYDKELFRAERPILRKILECDDASERKMILCVSKIIKSTQENEESLNIPRFEVEVTDGWYGVMATVDTLITSAITRGRLKVGTKIITCGADLLNVGQGKSPLEDISDVRLRLHGNSTRIAPWHSKLGLCPQGLLRISCDSLKARAGPVPVLHFLPIVVYPRSFVEKLPTGDTVTRSEKLEQVYLSSMEGETQSRIEQLYIDAEKELMEANKKQKENSAKRVSLLLNPKSRQQLSEDELLEIVEQASDPEDLMTLLSATQRESIINSLSKKQAIKRDKIDSRVKEMMKERNVGMVNRKVVSILKVRGLVLEVNKGVRKVVPVMLTVWKVQDAILELLNKMSLLNIYWAIPTGSKMGELHLSTGKQTFFAEVKNQNYIDNFPGVQRYIRKTSCIFEMNLPKFSPMFNEVDTVGLVFKIEPSIMSQTNHNSSTNSLQMSPNMQTVYMADEKVNIVAVHFWGGVVKFGYEKTIEEGKLLACCNLQHRPRSSVKRFRNLYATEYSTFCQCPRRKHLAELNQILENKLKNINRIEFLETCRKRLIELANKHKLNSISGVNSSTTSNASSFSNFSYSRSKRKLELDENSLSGLDFDSSFNEPSSVGISPNVISSRQMVAAFDGDTSDTERRIKKLRRLYDEPPPLSPVILNVSKSLKKEFITPPVEVTKLNLSSKIVPTDDKDGDSLLCDDKQESDPFKENFIYSPPDVE